MPTQQQQIKEMIEKYQNIIKIWCDKIVELRGRWLRVKDYMAIYWEINSYEACIQDLTKLQFLPQEKWKPDIVWIIMADISEHFWWWADTLIQDILTKHLTQKTTVPKDGEMNEYINQIEAMQVELDWYKNKNLENTKQECPKCKAAQWAWCMWCNKYVQIPHMCTSISTLQNS